VTIIHRYITESFAKYFCMVLVMVAAIYLSVDFLGRIDNFLEDGHGAGEILLFFVLKIPLIISQITPVAVLLSVLVVFGLMNKHNEITALKSGGVSVYYLLIPVFAVGLVVSVLLFVFSEVVVPISVSGANRIENARDPKVQTVLQKNIWLKSGKSIVHVKYFHPKDDALSGVSVYLLDADFNLSGRTDAVSAEYIQGTWVLHDCMEQKFDDSEITGSPPSDQPLMQPMDEDHGTRYYAQKEVDLGFSPEDFRGVAREPGEMSFAALGRYIARAEADGYDATRYRVNFHAKIAFPLVCLIMGLMAAAIALKGAVKDGMAVGFAYGIIIAFIYWSAYSFCLSLGYGGVLPAWAAPWCANVLFGLAAGVMILGLE